MKWLRDLIARIEGFSSEEAKDQEPSTDIEEGEKVIGEVPADLRNLFLYGRAVVERLNVMKRDHKKEHDDPNHTEEACEKFASSAAALMDEIEVVEKAFWRGLREELKFSADGVGVRKGWAVVEMPEEKPSSVIEVISISGGGSIADLLKRKS